MTLALAVLFGLLQGLRHAFEPDHVVAISTMITEQRGARARVAYAASWGLGHAVTLVCFGAVLMMARAQVPPRLDAAFEVAVSLMLVGLGGRAIVAAFVRGRGASSHAHGHTPSTLGRAGALAMGMVHGLAGSGALTALVVARMPSVATGVAIMVVFGAGATAGMSILAGAVGAPLARVLRLRWGGAALLAVTGSASLLLGVAWLVPAAARIH